MKDNGIQSILDSITDNHAEDSVFGGDSVADDCLPIDVGITRNTTRSQNSSISGNLSISHDEYSVDTPTTSSTRSLNIWPKRALLQEFTNVNSSTSEFDDTDQDPDVCLSLLVTIPNNSSFSSKNDITEGV